MNANQFTIKTVNPDDWPLLLDISRQTFVEAYAKDTDAADMNLYLSQDLTASIMQQQLQQPTTRFFFLQNEEEVMAYAKLRWDRPHEHFNGTAAIELERLYTRKAHWGKGLGSQLLAHCLAFAKRHQFEWMWLLVWHKNEAGIRFYQRHGFEHFGFKKFKFGTDVTNDWVMKRRV